MKRSNVRTISMMILGLLMMCGGGAFAGDIETVIFSADFSGAAGTSLINPQDIDKNGIFMNKSRL